MVKGLVCLCPLIINWGSPIYHYKQRGAKTHILHKKQRHDDIYILATSIYLHPIKHKGMHVDERDGGGGRSINSCLSIRMEGRQYT
jgi:hypothetical protein